MKWVAVGLKYNTTSIETMACSVCTFGGWDSSLSEGDCWGWIAGDSPSSERGIFRPKSLMAGSLESNISFAEKKRSWELRVGAEEEFWECGGEVDDESVKRRRGCHVSEWIWLWATSLCGHKDFLPFLILSFSLSWVVPKVGAPDATAQFGCRLAFHVDNFIWFFSFPFAFCFL